MSNKDRSARMMFIGVIAAACVISGWFKHKPVDYLHDVEHNVKHTWLPPAHGTGFVISSFLIGKNGLAEDYRIENSSGNEELNRSAAKSLEIAMFDAPPEQLSQLRFYQTFEIQPQPPFNASEWLSDCRRCAHDLTVTLSISVLMLELIFALAVYGWLLNSAQNKRLAKIEPKTVDPGEF